MLQEVHGSDSEVRTILAEPVNGRWLACSHHESDAAGGVWVSVRKSDFPRAIT